MSLGDQLKARLELSRREIAEEETQKQREYDKVMERKQVTQTNFEARFKTLDKRLQIEESVRQICLALDAEFIKRPSEFMFTFGEFVSKFRFIVQLTGEPSDGTSFDFVIEVIENSTHIYLHFGDRYRDKVEITESDFLNQEKMESLVWDAFRHPFDERPSRDMSHMSD